MTIQTIKFSQMTDGGDIANNDQVPGLLGGGNVLFNNPWTFLPPGSTADRPTPSSEINYRLRFNTTDQLYEYYDAVLGEWTQLQESAFTVGPFITYTADSSLPDAQNIGLLADGILKQTVTAGVSLVEIAVNGIDYWAPGDALTRTQAPVVGDDVTNKTYVDAQIAGTVTSATGTQFQVLVNGTFGTQEIGDIVLTTPQDIDTTSDVIFNSVIAGNLELNGSTLSSISTDSNISIIPNGNGITLVGSQVAATSRNGGIFQVIGINEQVPVAIASYGSTYYPVLNTLNSRSSTIGTFVPVHNGDTLFIQYCAGDDGTQFTIATSFEAFVSGAVSTGIVPGALQWSTANLSGVLTPALTLDSTQAATFGGNISTPSGTITAGGNITTTNGGLFSGTISGGAQGAFTAYSSVAAMGSLSLTCATNTGNYSNILINASTTASRTWTLPDATGTLALTSGVPSIGDFVFTANTMSTVNTNENIYLQPNGTGKTVITNSATPSTAFLGQFGIVSVSASASQTIDTYSANTGQSSQLYLAKSHSTTPGSFSAIGSAEVIGQIFAYGDDGTQFSQAAAIRFFSNGTISNGVVPGQIQFLTSNAAGSPTQALAIDSSQQATFTNNILQTGFLQGTTQIQNAAAQILVSFTTGGGTPVNYLTIQNNPTGASPNLTGNGTDTNVGINLLAKGSGQFAMYSTNTTPLLILNGTAYQRTNQFLFADVSGNFAYTFPQATGTIALTTDIPNAVLLSPSGNQTITNHRLIINDGVLILGDPTAGAVEGTTALSMYSPTGNLGNLGIYSVNNTGNFINRLQNAATTGNRTWTLPDESGTIALAGSASSGYVLLAPAGSQAITVGSLSVTGGNIIAGNSAGGAAGFFASYPSTASMGALLLQAVNSSGNFNGIINNASLSAARTWVLPDASGTMLVTGAAINSVPSITFSSTSGVIGTTTNNNAAAGSVGEVITASAPIGSPVILSTGVTSDIITVNLTAGDWDVWGLISLAGGSGILMTQVSAWLNTTSVTAPSDGLGGGAYVSLPYASAANGSVVTPVGSTRISVATTTTIYLSVNVSFSVASLGCAGIITARRRR